MELTLEHVADPSGYRCPARNGRSMRDSRSCRPLSRRPTGRSRRQICTAMIPDSEYMMEPRASWPKGWCGVPSGANSTEWTNRQAPTISFLGSSDMGTSWGMEASASLRRRAFRFRSWFSRRRFRHPLTSETVAPTIGGLSSGTLKAPTKVTPMKRLLAISLMLFFPVVIVAEDAKNLLKPVNKAESWRLEQHEGGQATLKISDDAATFNATKVTGTNWHVQVFQTDLDLKEGTEYTLKLKLTASQRRNVMLVAMIDTADWHEIGLHEDLTVDKEVRPFEFTFRASGVVSMKNRIGFVMGDETGDLIVKEMTLTEKVDKK